MMTNRRFSGHWRDLLLPLRGRLQFDQSLAKMTWFRVGGAADLVFRPADLADLTALLKALPESVPVFALGVGSNLLVRDGGLQGVVVRLGRGLADIRIEGNDIIVGAGALDVKVAQAAAQAGLAGMEFLRGIPGTIGGAVKMNAGAYDRELSDILVEVAVLDRQGEQHWLAADRLGLSYRHSALSEEWIVVQARLRGVPGDVARITADMEAIHQRREASQPIRERTGGSTFKNPTPNKAWQLIDAAGCRGLVRGDAQVSDKHCNFLINRGRASAADLEGLGEEVRRRVKAHSDIDLQWEIKRIGCHKALLKPAAEGGQ